MWGGDSKEVKGAHPWSRAAPQVRRQGIQVASPRSRSFLKLVLGVKGDGRVTKPSPMESIAHEKA